MFSACVVLTSVDEQSDAASTSFQWYVGDSVSDSMPGTSITSGSLPSGVTATVSSQMILFSGVPTEAGTFNITLNSGNTATITVSWRTASFSWVVGQTVSSNMPGTSITSGSLPSGVTTTVSSQMILFSGAPTASGTFTIYTDSGYMVTITVSSASSVSYTSPSAVDALTGSTVSYKPTVNVSGSTFATTTVTGKSNATWLTFASGTLSGTAPSVTSLTTYYYSIQATTPGGQTAVQTVSFNVYPVAKIDTSVSTSYNLTQNTAMTSIALSGNVSMTWGKSGDFPAGVSLSGSTISGTPTEYGTFTITLKGYTTAGPSQIATKKVVFTVAEQTMTITSTAPSGTYYTGKNYTYSPSVNLSAGCTWSLSSNPSWIVLSDGLITGTIPADVGEGTVEYTLTARSAGGQVVSQTCSFQVEPQGAFTSVPTAACVVIPVYTYGDDGNYSILSSIILCLQSIGSVFDVDMLDADDAPATYDHTLNYTVGTSVDAILLMASETYEITSPEGASSIPGLSITVGVQAGNPALMISGTPTTAGTYVVRATCLNDDVYNFTIVIAAASEGSPGGSSSEGSSGEGSSSGGSSNEGSSGNGSSGDSSGNGSSGNGSDSGSSGNGSSSESDSAEATVYNSTNTRTFRFVWTGEDASYVMWDFGDGSEKVKGFDVRHTYKENGTYTYTCTGVNDVGSSSCTGIIVVDVPLVKHLLTTYLFYIILAIIVLVIIIVAVVASRSKKKSSRSRKVSYDHSVRNSNSGKGSRSSGGSRSKGGRRY